MKKSHKYLIAGLTILLAVLTVLKLLGIITWPWIYVLAPGWLPFATVMFIVAVAVEATDYHA